MKVYEGQGPILQETNSKVKKDKSHGDEFRKIMGQMNIESEKTKQIEEYKSIQPVINGIEIVRGVDKAQQTSETMGNKQVVETLKETLDIIDFYASKLGDRSMNMSGLSPLINHLEDRLQVLGEMEIAEDVSDKIKPVISDLKITIATEIEKYQRGDYI
jgi:hypothetical protein